MPSASGRVEKSQAFLSGSSPYRGEKKILQMHETAGDQRPAAGEDGVGHVLWTHNIDVHQQADTLISHFHSHSHTRVSTQTPTVPPGYGRGPSWDVSLEGGPLGDECGLEPPGFPPPPLSWLLSPWPSGLHAKWDIAQTCPGPLSVPGIVLGLGHSSD